MVSGRGFSPPGAWTGSGVTGPDGSPWWFLFLPGGWQPQQQQSEASLLSLLLVLFLSDRGCSLEGQTGLCLCLAQDTVGPFVAWSRLWGLLCIGHGVCWEQIYSQHA